MPTTTLSVIALTLGLTGSAMAQERLLISSEWGKVTAELAENDATRALVRMLPITIEMDTSKNPVVTGGRGLVRLG